MYLVEAGLMLNKIKLNVAGGCLNVVRRSFGPLNFKNFSVPIKTKPLCKFTFA